MRRRTKVWLWALYFAAWAFLLGIATSLLGITVWGFYYAAAVLVLACALSRGRAPQGPPGPPPPGPPEPPRPPLHRPVS